MHYDTCFICIIYNVLYILYCTTFTQSRDLKHFHDCMYIQYLTNAMCT